jgi:hypothetical protein
MKIKNKEATIKYFSDKLQKRFVDENNRRINREVEMKIKNVAR